MDDLIRKKKEMTTIPAIYKPSLPPTPERFVTPGRSYQVVGAVEHRSLVGFIEKFGDLPVTVDVENIQQHDQFARDISTWRKALEKRRKELKEIPLEEGRAIDASAREADAVAEAMQSVAVAAVLHVAELVRVREAEVEARRRRAEADALERERAIADERARLEEMAKPGDRLALDELEHEHRSAAQAAYLDTLDVQPELPKLHVGVTSRTELEVHDESMVPTHVAGVCVRPVDKAACKALLKAGVEVPGCRMVPKKGAAVR